MAEPPTVERLFAILKSKILNFRDNFLKIVIILCKRLIDNRLLLVFTVNAFIKKYFAFRQTIIFVNITIPIKYALTRSTKTFTKKRCLSKAY